MDMLKLIKQAGIQAVEQSAPAAIMLGVVKQVNPLVITVEQHLDIPAEFLLLTDNVRDYQTKISFDNSGIKNIVKNYSMSDEAGTDYKLTFQAPVQNEITVYNGLRVGEQVLLIRAQGGQKFIVLNRVVKA
jgi:glycyl-tRNA synthetase (class II)